MNIDEKIAQIGRAIADMTRERRKLLAIKADQRYGRMTIGEIREQWDNGDSESRYEMISNIPAFQDLMKESMDNVLNAADVEPVNNCEFGEDNEHGIDIPWIFSLHCRPGGHAKEGVKA